MNALLLLQGTETQPLRMERHCHNALKVEEYLQGHGKVKCMRYAVLKSDPYYDQVQKHMGGRPASLLTFYIKSGFDAGVLFYNALWLFKRLVNIGDIKSLACHPTPDAHRQLTEDELKTAGMIRLCVGIEDMDDFIADLEQALDA